MNSTRHDAYVRVRRALQGEACGGLTERQRELLRDRAEDLLLSAGGREKATLRSAAAGSVLLLGLVQAARLERVVAEELWQDLCDCGPDGLWRPFASRPALFGREWSSARSGHAL
jgi:hypothetical protein